MRLNKIQNVTCIGAGFVGGPLGAIIAYQCPTIAVTVVDKDRERIDAWQKGTPPFHEPGLIDILATIQQRNQPNLRFSIDIPSAIQQADIIFLCVDTPTKSFGADKGSAPDLTSIQTAARSIAHSATGDTIIVEKSTIPCGTSDMLRDLLNACSQARFEVLSNPEFLSEGTAISDLQNPSRVLIGSQDTPTGHEAAEILAALYRTWIPASAILTMDCWSSELAKLAANAMLAQRISNINSLSAICEATGANIDSVALACGLDPRIGPHMLQAGLGWGGSCFQKDILDLVYIARSLALNQVADYWAQVIDMNEYQQARFLRRIVACMYGSVSGRCIAVLGFAFKKNTSDTKNSPAISLVRGLLDEGARVSVYDPLVPANQILAALQLSDAGQQRRIRISACPYDACSNADAVVVATEMDQFVTPAEELGTADRRDVVGLSPPPEVPEGLDWGRIVGGMQSPKFAFDGRNCLDGGVLTGLGCRYVRVGRGGEAS